MNYDKQEILTKLRTAKNLTELVEIKNKLSKQLIDDLQSQLAKASDVQEKRTIGMQINQTKVFLQEDFIAVRNEFAKTNNNVHYVVKDATDTLEFGRFHILEQVNDELLGIFKELGFDIKCGDDIVSTYWNFDVLNIPETHPSRAMHDSFFFDPLTILKTQNTSYSAYFTSLVKEKRNDIRICSYGPVYRKDDDDATHSHQFMQIDMIWIKDKLNIANLKWITDYMLKKFFGNQIKTRYRLSFFPFTEPSFEVDISCFKCHGKGCPTCKHSSWIEVMGAGVVHKNVIRNLGLDPDKYQGIAFGLGVERFAMLKYQVEDIRNFYANDFNFLKQFK